MALVKEIRDYLDGRVPFSTKLDFDNVGLLAGEPDRDAHRVLCALDVTDGVIEEAAALGAELIVAHHPLIFHALKRVCADDLVGRKIYALARGGISAICLHTNLDAAAGGVNDALIEALGCTETKPLGGAGAMPRVGRLPESMSLEAFLARTKHALGANGLRYVEGARAVSVVGCCGGSGGDFLEEALEAGCDTFVTADVKHDRFLAAAELGVNLIDGGHFSTENIVVPRLRQMLLEGFPELDVRLSRTQKQPERFYV
jgi:dinuclear metal center YbgI/SA1388 family protein